MQRFEPAHIVKSAIVLTLAIALMAAPAVAGPAAGTAPQLVSGLTPLPRELEPGWCGSPANFQDWESDQTLAVDPTNPDRLAVAWMQDAYDGIVVASSEDGGSSWGRVVISPFCAVPTQVSSDDPSLSFGPDGVLYLSWRLFQSNHLASSLLVNRSMDGGKTWSDPVVVAVAGDRTAIDVTQVLADPNRPGYAYLLWGEADFPISHPDLGCIEPASFFKHYVAHTEDGGATWSEPSEVPTRNDYGVGQLVVLPDGTLLDVIVDLPEQTTCTLQGPTTLVARRSSDFGAHWSEPSTIAEEPDAQSDISSPSAALAPDGSVYVAWQTRLPGVVPLPFSVLYSRSLDGGNTWQPQAPVGLTPLVGPAERMPSGALARPALGVAADGTVAVGFYDRRKATDASHRNAVDYWLRHSHDGGQTWPEDHLAGPFDLTLTPSGSDMPPGPSGAGFTGCCQGLAPLPGGFAASFILGEPFAAKNTDIFFSRIRIAMEADLSLTKSGPSGRVPTGRNMTYTLTVVNNGPDQAVGVATIDQLPPSAMFVSAAPSHGSCEESMGTVTCALGSLANGAVATVDIVVRPTSAETITNTASVSALTQDPNEANNTDSVGTLICRITSRRSSIACG